ncbi:MAG: CopG family transcriptional regulator [Exiguobacterium profundum]|nr:MAG: CopG family transcriptional regulator [Exiguobacterium profundum]
MTVEEFDHLFDEGSDEIEAFIDRSKSRMIYPKPQRVNVDFPPLMVSELDAVATARGVTRQALIKMWLADKLEEHRRGQVAEAGK